MHWSLPVRGRGLKVYRIGPTFGAWGPSPWREQGVFDSIGLILSYKDKMAKCPEPYSEV